MSSHYYRNLNRGGHKQLTEVGIPTVSNQRPWLIEELPRQSYCLTQLINKKTKKRPASPSTSAPSPSTGCRRCHHRRLPVPGPCALSGSGYPQQIQPFAVACGNSPLDPVVDCRIWPPAAASALSCCI
jgi:hypothetical protein